jgi:dipeptidyl aminopeptidase/acylaminoacyl peptidase
VRPPEEERAWEVVRRAYAERTPQPRRRHSVVVIPVLVVLTAAILAAVLSPPGRAVFERVRNAVGVEHADPALFSLPAPGRLLVVSTDGGGVWLVRDNGFKRRLGSFADAQWSPHGLYAVATTRDHLVALDEDAHVRWTLARAGAALPRWAGSLTDTRIAYLARSGLRVVGGDGRGDRLLDSTATQVAPAWVPGHAFDIAYVSGSGTIIRRDASSGQVQWRRQADLLPLSLEWSDDGRLLAVTSATRIVVLNARGTVVRTIGSLGATLVTSAFRPHSHQLAVSVRLAARSELKLVDVDHPGRARLLFAGPGTFGSIVWSPDGTTLLVDWPTANQWLFLRGSKVHAVGNIREEFPRADEVPPRLLVAGRWSR